MRVQSFDLRPDQDEPALQVLGTHGTVLASNAATQSCGITLQQRDEGTGPPPHSHVRRDGRGVTGLRAGRPDR